MFGNLHLSNMDIEYSASGRDRSFLKSIGGRKQTQKLAKLGRYMGSLMLPGQAAASSTSSIRPAGAAERRSLSILILAVARHRKCRLVRRARELTIDHLGGAQRRRMKARPLRARSGTCRAVLPGV